ncbi:MAG: lactate utilization protein [Bacteroidia bacterium]|nr:lactate utilization protein [Bacteroidia bacterium]
MEAKQQFNTHLAFALANNELVQQRTTNAQQHLHATNGIIAERYARIDVAKSRAEALKFKSIENLERLLIDFEYAFTRRNGKVIWCETLADVEIEFKKINQKNKLKWNIHSQDSLIKELSVNEYILNNELNAKTTNAQLDIYTAAFITADAGAVIIANQPPLVNKNTNVILATIDCLIPKLTDVDLFLPLLSTYKNKQLLQNEISIVFGNEEKSNSETLLFIIDNGRTKILEQIEQRKALYCINCDACNYVCPVSNTVGEEGFVTATTGPIAMIKNQFQYDLHQYKHLSYASTMCGKCSDVCPVNIDIHQQLINNRKHIVEKNLTSKSDNIALFFWKSNMLKRSKIEKGGATLKNFMLKQFFKKQWGDEREFPVVHTKSFNQLWREKNKK